MFRGGGWLVVTIACTPSIPNILHVAHEKVQLLVSDAEHPQPEGRGQILLLGKQHCGNNCVRERSDRWGSRVLGQAGRT